MYQLSHLQQPVISVLTEGTTKLRTVYQRVTCNRALTYVLQSTFLSL